MNLSQRPEVALKKKEGKNALQGPVSAGSSQISGGGLGGGVWGEGEGEEGEGEEGEGEEGVGNTANKITITNVVWIRL